MNKVYVDVVAEFRKDGKLVPIFFTWEDGKKYNIDRILKIERCASRKAVVLCQEKVQIKYNQFSLFM